jgi:monoamine oxidase
MRDRSAAARTGLPPDAVREARAVASRRRFLLGTAATIGAVPIVGACSEHAPAVGKDVDVFGAGGSGGSGGAGGAGGGAGGGGSSAPRIAIVGAGIAGLACALELLDKGVEATVYDISRHRVGGRMVSERGSEPTGCNSCHAAPADAPKMSWADGQVTDVYCELIDSDHLTMKALAKRFSIPLVDALGAEPEGATETWWFGGGYYPVDEAEADFALVYDALQQDATDAGWPVTWDTAPSGAKKLDAMTAREWIETRVPGGVASRLGAFIDAAYAMEFGADTEDQSALNILSMLSDSEVAPFSVLGASDERWRIEGGVDRLPRAIAEKLGVGKRVKLGWELLAVRANADGSNTLAFATADEGFQEVRADHVVLALPFPRLRTIDLSKAALDERKRKAIAEQGAGKNRKIQLQFDKRLWNEAGPWGKSGGTAYGDTGFQLAWDPTRGQAGKSGILVGYTGGSAATAAKLKHPYGNQGNPAVVEDAKAFLAQIEPVFPGLGATWNGKCAETLAHLDGRFNTSYAYYRVGQTTAFGGYERVRQGNVWFCGEHTSIEFLGFMEGAASEGQAAAAEVLAALGIATTSTYVRRRKRRRS